MEIETAKDLLQKIRALKKHLLEKNDKEGYVMTQDIDDQLTTEALKIQAAEWAEEEKTERAAEREKEQKK